MWFVDLVPWYIRAKLMKCPPRQIVVDILYWQCTMTIVHFLLFLSSAEFWMLCVTTTTKEVETKANVCSSVFSLQHCECLVVFWYFEFFCEFWEPSVTTTTTSPKEWNRASAKPNLGSVDSLSPRCSCALQHSVNFHWKHCRSEADWVWIFKSMRSIAFSGPILSM